MKLHAITIAIELGSPEAGAAKTTCLVRIKAFCKGSVSKLVVQLSFFFITQDIIGFCDLFKLFFRLCIPRVGIGMVFLCQSPKRFLYRTLIRFLVDTQDFIIISLGRHPNSPTFLFKRKLATDCSQPLLFLSSITQWRSSFSALPSAGLPSLEYPTSKYRFQISP